MPYSVEAALARRVLQGRGIPPDASALVSNAYAENRANIEQHADGDFGHTFALVSEIRALEQPVWDQVASSEDTGWRNVFAAIDAFPPWQEAELVRLVVWAYW